MKHRMFIVLVAALAAGGAALAWGRGSIGAVLLALGAGLAAGYVIPWRRAARPAPDPGTPLLGLLVEMGDALQEVSIRALTERGGWEPALFESVLTRVEQQTPRFQAALARYFSQPAPLPPDQVNALLAVDRLSAAYTYWTRLFPPRRQQESMFVLSLLQDLSDKVEHAIRLLDTGTHG